MTATARQRLEFVAVDGAFWPHIAGVVDAWLGSVAAAPRDAVVLLPHSALLAPARSAFAARGGWQPRIETTATLAAALAPPTPSAPSLPSGDRATDRLVAAALLRRQAFGAAWAERDPRAFHAAVGAFVATADSLAQASAWQRSEDRTAWWDAVRQALPSVNGPGGSERLLARMAVEWAASAEAPATDELYSLPVSAWVVLSADGIVGLPLSAAPTLHLLADSDPARPFDDAAALPAPTRWRASGLEDEASAATLCVLEALDSGAPRVALIAQDRLVVRRIRALLERAGVACDDETGWILSTTRAAAHVMAWLRAATPGAGRDALIEALRAEGHDERAVSALENAWRREREPNAFALTALNDMTQRIAAWQPDTPRALSDWLLSWRDAAPGLVATLEADAAGRQVVALLHWLGTPPAAWQSAAQATRLDLAGFTAWVDDTLEGSHWRPPQGGAAGVAIVPLARAALRPWGAIVFPGCDARHLGGADAAPGLLPTSVARQFGIVDAAQLRAQETQAFAQLLRAPRLMLLRRTHDGGEPLAPSALVERAMLARRRLGADTDDERDVVLPVKRVARLPVTCPAPSMDRAMPARLSATTAQALRDCPYRFFAKVALGLSEGDELDDALDNSDYGRWVHALLYRFHKERGGQTVSSDLAELQAAAESERVALALDSAALLPFRVAFDTFAGNYLAWLYEHEAEGWKFVSGEVDRRCAPPDLDGVALEGRLDRIDTNGDGAAMLIDYKTGNREKVKKRVAEPLEDTQLAFYAALLNSETHSAPPRAIYLSLVERDAPEPFEHDDVALSAALLIDGLSSDLASLRAGEGAPASGEGDVCETCEMRGLCRRDHWSDNA
jgi:ATP-dependent helicase/nuclease subunit B